MKFKAVVIDVDGTITFTDRRLDCRAVEVLRGLKVPVVIATGNVLCFARAVSRLVGTGGILIAENGGVIECNTTVEYNTDHLGECEKAFDVLKKHFALVKLDPEFRKTEITLRRDFDVEKAKQLLNEYPEIEIMDTGFAVHIKSKRINKGTGLRRVAELMGLDARDFVALGDSPNDIEMLKAAGFGVAVGNAHPALKKAADMVTEGEHGAGVAEAMQYLAGKGMLG